MESAEDAAVASRERLSRLALSCDEVVRAIGAFFGFND
jgi:hypothetical protein